MDWSQILLLALIGTMAGFLSGLLGIGGAVIVIPALMFFLKFSQPMAQGTTLVMLIPPVGALAAWQYYRTGNADWKVAFILAVFFFISGYLGAKFANVIPQETLRKIFAVMLILIAVQMLFFEKNHK